MAYESIYNVFFFLSNSGYLTSNLCNLNFSCLAEMTMAIFSVLDTRLLRGIPLYYGLKKQGITITHWKIFPFDKLSLTSGKLFGKGKCV